MLQKTTFGEKMDNRNLKQAELQILRRKIVEAAIKPGVQQKAVAETFGFTEATVSRYVRAYKAKGEFGLIYKKRGRPAETISKLSNDEQGQARHIIKKSTPDKEGLQCVLWTRKSVREMIEKKFKIRYSVRGMGNVLQRWGFTPQKPLKVAIQQSAIKVQQWIANEYPEIKSRALKESAEILWGDEMGLRSNDQRGRTYGLKGQTPAISKTGSRFSCNMIAAISNVGSMKWMVFESNFTVTVFIEFLRRLIYKTGKKIFLIVDNHAVHHAKKTQEWLARHKKKIELFYLPPYSPELNPQELVNQEVKGHANNFHIIKSAQDLSSNLRSYLAKIQFNACKIINYFKKKSVSYAA